MQASAAKLLPYLAAAALTLTGTALLAQPGGWGGPGWGMRAPRAAPSLEGQIDVARFRAEGIDQAALFKGPIVVIRMPGDEGAEDPRLTATFEAAVEGQLVSHGYLAGQSGDSGQIAEVRIVRSEAEPAEEKRNPVSGEMSVGVSNRGSMVGMAIHVDGNKPRKALIATRLETRIRDRASGQVLWEGRAQMFSRDGDERWDDDAIAARLSKSLFAGFPERTGEARERR
jgi:hypothetical protein